MKVAVFGANGMVGSAIVAEGRRRGHAVTTVSAREGAADVVGDVTVPGDVERVSAGEDAVVIAVPPPRTGASHEPWEEGLEALSRMPLGARLLLVGGAGSTLADGRRLLDGEGFPPAYLPEAKSHARVLDTFRDFAADGVDWTILSPAPAIGPGGATGAYRTGDDDVVGERISTEDFALAVWDELERPVHRRARFTVAS